MSFSIKPIKYNPDKTHFEQALDFLEHQGNPDISLDEFFQISIKYIDGLLKANKINTLEAELTKKSLIEDVKHDIYTYKTFIRDGKKNYKIAKDFSHALIEASLDISCRYIPKTTTSYNIQFHRDITLKSIFGNKDEAYHNCYVSIEGCNSDYDKEKGYLKRIMLVFPIYKYGKEWASTYDYINLVFKDENQKVSEAIQDSANLIDNQKLSNEGRDVIKYITNIILYINSGDPDLREIRKPKIPKQAKNLKKFEKKNRHRTLLDIVEVGFNYMKEINYRVSSTVVRGHFRWQPFGPKREQIKLIWINEHKRSFDIKI